MKETSVLRGLHATGIAAVGAAVSSHHRRPMSRGAREPADQRKLRGGSPRVGAPNPGRYFPRPGSTRHTGWT